MKTCHDVRKRYWDTCLIVVFHFCMVPGISPTLLQGSGAGLGACPRAEVTLNRFCNLCRPVGQFFAPYMPYSGSQGLVTSEQNVVLLLVWSEPVTGLTPNSFSVSGPSVTASIVSGLKLLRGTNTYYHLTVNLPGDYYGGVTVTLQVSFALSANVATRLDGSVSCHAERLGACCMRPHATCGGGAWCEGHVISTESIV